MLSLFFLAFVKNTKAIIYYYPSILEVYLCLNSVIDDESSEYICFPWSKPYKRFCNQSELLASA